MSFQKIRIALLALALSLSLTTLVCLRTIYHSRIQFNQFTLELRELSSGSISFEVVTDLIRSSVSEFIENLVTADRRAQVRFEDPRDVFEFIFENAPRYAVVYPTETYYYYNFDLPNTHVSGNLRLLDAQLGKIHIGYFDRDRPHAKSYAATFTEKDGVDIKQLGPYLFDVTYKKKTVRFKLNDIAPKPVSGIKILPEEEFVSQIYDESGTKLVLYYNNNTKTFYFLLANRSDAHERLVELTPEFIKGERSDFIYYFDKDYDRTQLVGVYRGNVYANNHFDGPFDQVPPRLQLKEKVNAAYPYTTLAGGIDQHGNFLGFRGTRISISPYYDYDDFNELESYLGRCKTSENKSEFWSCLAYEWKRDFHKTVKLTPSSEHRTYASQGWPANHHGTVSLGWPASHVRAESLSWPPGHLIERSDPDAKVAGAALDPSELEDPEEGHIVYLSQGWPANHSIEPSYSWPEEHRRADSLAWAKDHVGELSLRE